MGRRILTWVAVAAAAVALGCGGGGPSSPSSTGVEVQGVVLGEGTSFAASSGSHPASAKAQKVTVTVKDTAITAEVGADGTFVLKGVPSGKFTLVFTVDGVKVGEVPIEAPDGSEVKVTVKVAGGQVVVVDIKIDPGHGGTPVACVISGGKPNEGIELEGTVDSGAWQAFKMKVNGERGSALVDVTATEATTYKCIGGAKTDTVDQCRALVAAGQPKVHVRGTLKTCDAASALVTASEVKIQKD
jgi:hypothetical protein